MRLRTFPRLICLPVETHALQSREPLSVTGLAGIPGKRPELTCFFCADGKPLDLCRYLACCLRRLRGDIDLYAGFPVTPPLCHPGYAGYCHQFVYVPFEHRQDFPLCHRLFSLGSLAHCGRTSGNRKEENERRHRSGAHIDLFHDHSVQGTFSGNGREKRESYLPISRRCLTLCASGPRDS